MYLHISQYVWNCRRNFPDPHSNVSRLVSYHLVTQHLQDNTASVMMFPMVETFAEPSFLYFVQYFKMHVMTLL